MPTTIRTLAIAALLLVVGLPLGFVGLQAIFPGLSSGSLAAPFSHWPTVFADPALLELLFNTVALGLTVVVLAGLLGGALGLLRGLCRLPGAALWDVAMLVPFMVPPYIAALGWILLLQPAGYLQQLTGVHAGPLLFSFGGVAFVMTLNVFPVVYFAVSRTLAAIGTNLVDAARISGARPHQTLFRIILPLAAPGVAASLLLVFAMAIEEYGTPAALAADAGFFVLVTGIEKRFADWPVDLPGASILSMLLVLLAASAFLLQRHLLARRSWQVVGGRPSRQAGRELGRWTLPTLACFGIATGVACVAPIASVAATAFSATLSGGLALDNLTTAHFRALFAPGSEALLALRTSLTLGVGAALITGLLGALVAWLVVRERSRWSGLLDALGTLPNMLPGIVVAVGLILAWNRGFWPVTPYDTVAILLLAYVCLLLPYPVRYAHAALLQMGENLEAAGRVHGASWAAVMGRIVLPLIFPTLLAAMLMVFAVASRELVASLLLAPTGTWTVAAYIWRQFEQGSIAQGMAMSLVAVGVTGSIALAAALYLNRRGGQLRP